MVDWLLDDGRVTLLAMAIIVAELALASRIARRGWRAFSANALAGIGLIAALHAALAGFGGLAVLAGLTVSFVAHLFYLMLLRAEGTQR